MRKNSSEKYKKKGKKVMLDNLDNDKSRTKKNKNMITWTIVKENS